MRESPLEWRSWQGWHSEAHLNRRSTMQTNTDESVFEHDAMVSPAASSRHRSLSNVTTKVPSHLQNSNEYPKLISVQQYIQAPNRPTLKRQVILEVVLRTASGRERFIASLTSRKVSRISRPFATARHPILPAIVHLPPQPAKERADPS